MIETITALLTPVAAKLAAGAFAAIGLLAAYLGVRRSAVNDLKRKIEAASEKKANEIRKAGADARDHANDGELRKDDGFKRD